MIDMTQTELNRRQRHKEWAFHKTLSDRSVYARYFSSPDLNTRIAHERLARLCFVHYGREIALVVDKREPVSGHHGLLGIGRVIKLRDGNHAEVAGLVSDQSRGQGLGTKLFRKLIEIARHEGLSRVSAEMLSENFAMRRLADKLGLRTAPGPISSSVTALLDLRAGARIDESDPSISAGSPSVIELD